MGASTSETRDPADFGQRAAKGKKKKKKKKKKFFSAPFSSFFPFPSPAISCRVFSLPEIPL